VLDWSGLPIVHIRPTFFSEWLKSPWVRDTMLKEGKIALPYGSGRHAPISGKDQARVIAALLARPAGHIGQIYPLFGAVELSQQEIAETVGHFLDRKIVYRPESVEQYRERLATYGVPDFIVQHFIEVAIDYQNGIFAGTGDAVKKITGQAPESLEAFLKANRDVFNV
jgi:NAD(P)H dehydrogenase (quinone)